MNSFLDRARWWSYRAQFLGRKGTSLEAALHDLCGVYSSHPSGPLSLYARVPSFEPKAFRELDRQRTALRVPAMRRSIYLLLREDAPAVFSATSTLASQAGWPLSYLRSAGVSSSDAYAEVKRRILAATGDPRTARELRSEAGIHDVQITPVLQVMAFDGSLLRLGGESLRSNTVKYVATESWLGGELPEVDPDRALASLAAGYLRAFGPARIRDFGWWAGVPTARAAAALRDVPTVSLEEDYLLLADDLAAFTKVKPPPQPALDILPKWDAYTMGYAPDGRGRFVAPQHQPAVYDSGGNGLGIVLVDGAAAGVWAGRFAGKKMNLELQMFKRPDRTLSEAVRSEFEKIAALLGVDSPALNR